MALTVKWDEGENASVRQKCRVYSFGRGVIRIFNYTLAIIGEKLFYDETVYIRKRIIGHTFFDGLINWILISEKHLQKKCENGAVQPCIRTCEEIAFYLWLILLTNWFYRLDWNLFSYKSDIFTASSVELFEFLHFLYGQIKNHVTTVGNHKIKSAITLHSVQNRNITSRTVFETQYYATVFFVYKNIFYCWSSLYCNVEQLLVLP